MHNYASSRPNTIQGIGQQYEPFGLVVCGKSLWSERETWDQTL